MVLEERGQNLDGHVSCQSRISSAVNLAHAASADQLLYIVIFKSRSRFDAHRLEKRLGCTLEGFGNPLLAVAIMSEQRLHFAAQLPVPGAGRVQERSTLLWAQV